MNKKKVIILFVLCTSFYMKASMIVHYEFNTGTGTIAFDSSGNGFDATISGATWTTDRFGNNNSAINTGQNKYVDPPNAPLKPAICTLAAWIYIEGYDSSAAPIFSAEKGWGASGFAYRLQITPAGNLRMEAIAPYSTSPARVVTSSEALDTHQWCHVAGTYDGTNTSIYINGKITGTVSAVSYAALNTDSTIPVGIGHLDGWSVQWFRGNIDDARIYDEALSEAEIAAIVAIPEPILISFLFVGTIWLGALQRQQIRKQK